LAWIYILQDRGGYLGYSGCDFIERDEYTLGAASNQVMGSSYQDELFVKMINMDI
jgi:hypothetical protein